MASRILGRVEDGAAFAAPLLASAAADLRADDRALAHELVLGCLRWQLWLDRLISHYAERSAEDLDPPVRRVLRLGLYQLRFLTRVPASAAVNESVLLVRRARVGSAAGFVNAVLRRATREPTWNPADDIADPIARIAVSRSHPEWIIRRWIDAFGMAEAEAIAAANNRTPTATFRIASLHVSADAVVEELQRAGVPFQPSPLVPNSWRLDASANSSRQAASVLRQLAANGSIYLQDDASQLVSHVVGPVAGENVLDACAAPGGKTSHLALLSGDQALIVAGDIHAHRVRDVVRTAARLDLRSIVAVVHDASTQLPFAAETFHRVLVDAPCSGTGTLRHNPEIRWRLRESDIRTLAQLQKHILATCSAVVRPGGRLVYSTCSLEPEENEHVLSWFLDTHTDFRPTSLSPSPTPTPTGGSPQTTRRTWPHRDDAEGFFVVALERHKPA